MQRMQVFAHGQVRQVGKGREDACLRRNLTDKRLLASTGRLPLGPIRGRSGDIAGRSEKKLSRDAPRDDEKGKGALDLDRKGRPPLDFRGAFRERDPKQRQERSRVMSKSSIRRTQERRFERMGRDQQPARLRSGIPEMGEQPKEVPCQGMDERAQNTLRLRDRLSKISPRMRQPIVQSEIIKLPESARRDQLAQTRNHRIDKAMAKYQAAVRPAGVCAEDNVHRAVGAMSKAMFPCKRDGNQQPQCAGANRGAAREHEGGRRVNASGDSWSAT